MAALRFPRAAAMPLLLALTLALTLALALALAASASASTATSASAGRLSHLHRAVASHLQRRSKAQQVQRGDDRQDGERDVEYRKMVRWPFHLNELNNLNNMVEEEPPFNVERFNTDAEELGYKEPPELKPGMQGRDLVQVEGSGTNCKASDIMLILDLSTSLDATEMVALKKFVVELVEGFDLERALGNNLVRFGVLGFATDVKTISPVSADKTAILSSVDKMSNMGTGNSIDKALAEARRQLSQANRMGIRKLFVLVTDATLGTGREGALRESKLTKSPTSELYTMGVGSQISLDELRSIASDPLDKHVFFVAAYDDLVRELGDFTHAMCSGGA